MGRHVKAQLQIQTLQCAQPKYMVLTLLPRKMKEKKRSKEATMEEDGGRKTRREENNQEKSENQMHQVDEEHTTV